ncbi:MAG TPA: hypothetical protein VG917_03170 [Patescibacteria group bacterium]|nr:hypothetical protein [Patescibacteria group bacterium]
MNNRKPVLEFADTDGKKYVFHKKNYDKHSKRHPEILEPGYLKSLKEMILNCPPDMIFKSYTDRRAFVYYDSLAETPTGTWYNHAVIYKSKGIYDIATAFRFVGQIREKRYWKCENKRP